MTVAELIEDRPRRDPGPATIRLEPCAKRVRVLLGGLPVADSTRVQLMYETGRLPVYYFPIEDVRMDLAAACDHASETPEKGPATYFSFEVGAHRADAAMWQYRRPGPEAPPQLARLVAFYWGKMGAWFEEDEEVYVHPRDPYKRLDMLSSSRHVLVKMGGEIVADTRRPVLCFETRHPVRYYLPRQDVRSDLLRPSPTTTRCPYKGLASYYSLGAEAAAGEVVDVAWSYRHPTPEAAKLENRLCFFNERVDELYVDGELQPKPATRWA